MGVKNGAVQCDRQEDELSRGTLPGGCGRQAVLEELTSEWAPKGDRSPETYLKEQRHAAPHAPSLEMSKADEGTLCIPAQWVQWGKTWAGS